MQAARLPASAGWRWLAFGFAIVRKNPGQMVAVSIAYWLILAVASAAPFVGSVLGAVLAPGLSVGVMNVCRQIDRGENVNAAVLFSAFRSQTLVLLALGALYLAAALGVLSLSSLADGGTLLRLMTGGAITPEEFAAPEFQVAAQIAMFLMLPILMAWWYAPMLASWHGTPVVKSLFFSFVACWRNWKPFLAFAAGGLLLALPPFFLAILLAPGDAASAGALAAVLALPTMLLLAPLFFASFYVSYRDVFVTPDAPVPAVDVHA